MNATRAATVVLALVLALGTVLAGPALAHDKLIKSTPARGATVASLDKVILVFNANVQLPTVIVTGASGEHRLEATTERAVVTAPIPPGLPGGAYKVLYRVVSSDGHAIQGDIPFTLSALTTTSTPSAAPVAPVPPVQPTKAANRSEPRTTVPTWLWIIIGGLAGVMIGFYLMTRKGRGG